MKKYLALKDIVAYRLALLVSNKIWSMVISWKHFERDTIGKQFVRAADSISANIAEGFGRYTKKDKINFYRYAQGSLKETMDWTLKCRMRQVLNEEQYQRIQTELQQLPLALNSLIKYTNYALEK
jgi:four helix bundle protein